jgi:orotate phosphoribosyltransferase
VLDDVATTGATLEAASEALVAAGAMVVALLTVTRSEGGADETSGSLGGPRPGG